MLTSINQPFQGISTHRVWVELLEQQTQSIGLPLEIMQIREMPKMKVYENVMQTTLSKLKK